MYTCVGMSQKSFVIGFDIIVDIEQRRKRAQSYSERILCIGLTVKVKSLTYRMKRKQYVLHEVGFITRESLMYSTRRGRPDNPGENNP